MLVKGIAVIRVWIYFKFHYKQRYIFNRHSSIVWILYGKLLIKTGASCTCLIIICQLIWFAGPRGKYVSCFEYIITTCSSFCLYYIDYLNCSILLIPRCIGQLSAIFYHCGKIRPQKHDPIIPYSRRGWRFLAQHHCFAHRCNFHCLYNQTIHNNRFGMPIVWPYTALSFTWKKEIKPCQVSLPNGHATQ